MPSGVSVRTRIRRGSWAGCVVLLLLLLSCLLIIFGLCAPSAAAEPTPIPTTGPRSSPSGGTRDGLPAEPDPNRPRLEKPARSRSIPASARKVPGDLAKPVRKLISDLTSGKLSKGEAARLANQMVSDPTSAPKARRLTSATTETDLMVLGAIVGASLDSSTRPAPHDPNE